MAVDKYIEEKLNSLKIALNIFVVDKIKELKAKEILNKIYIDGFADGVSESKDEAIAYKEAMQDSRD